MQMKHLLGFMGFTLNRMSKRRNRMHAKETQAIDLHSKCLYRIKRVREREGVKEIAIHHSLERPKRYYGKCPCINIQHLLIIQWNIVH